MNLANLLWIDLETTGLHPEHCEILEVAAGVAQLSKPFTLLSWYETPLKPHVDLFHVDPFVLEMHQKSGLWHDCRDKAAPLADVEAKLIGMLPVVGPTMVAGSSVGFDLGFIRKHMPALAAKLHYRVYDVTAVRLFAESLGMPSEAVCGTAAAHRAGADIRASIEMAQKISRWFCKP